jgi:hypothetical protein
MVQIWVESLVLLRDQEEPTNRHLKLQTFAESLVLLGNPVAPGRLLLKGEIWVEYLVLLSYQEDHRNPLPPRAQQQQAGKGKPPLLLQNQKKANDYKRAFLLRILKQPANRKDLQLLFKTWNGFGSRKKLLLLQGDQVQTKIKEDLLLQHEAHQRP